MTKQHQFPNKMIQMAYNSAIGKTFTWSPTNQKFTDENGNSEYNYHAMLWLKDSTVLEETFDKHNLVYLYKVK